VRIEGGNNASTGPDKIMVLIGMLSMAWGSYLTLQRDDTDEMRQAIGVQARQIAVLEYKIDALLQERHEQRQRGGE
jgi:nitrate reductase gamma subunit